MSTGKLHDIKGFSERDVCSMYNDYGKFYIQESINDEQDAVGFYTRVIEKLGSVMDENDMAKIEHIIMDEEEHAEMFDEIKTKFDSFCSRFQVR